MDVGKLQDLGWHVYPSMVVKEQEYPYCKCVASVKKGKIHKLYWNCVGIPTKLKQKFIEELEQCKR